MPPIAVFLFRAVSALLRRFFPFLKIGKKLIVTRHKDVTEILRRDSDFTISQINGPNINDLNGKFILGMDCPEYGGEAYLLRKAIHPEDPDKIFSMVNDSAEGIVNSAGDAGRIDAVADLSRNVAVDIVDQYFGVPAPDGNRELMKEWMRTLFHGIFLNLSNKPDIRNAALASYRGLSEYLTKLVAERKQSPARDDFIGRLIAMQDDPKTRMDDNGVQRNVAGMIVGAVDTTSKTAALALDQILGRPHVLSAAQKAAETHDLRHLGHIIREALRFNPHNPIIIRYCTRDTAVGTGAKTRNIKEGTTVYAVTLSAMFDKAAFPHPREFRADRYDANYLHFGYGLHSCFGQYINEISIPALLAPLFRLNGLRRAHGPAGKLVFDGPFPNHLVVEFNT